MMIEIKNDRGKLFGDFDDVTLVAKINYVEVKRSHRKKGYGSELVDSFLKECKSRGMRSIKINAYYKALAFWKKQKFIITPERQVSHGHIQDYHDGILCIRKKITRKTI